MIVTRVGNDILTTLHSFTYESGDAIFHELIEIDNGKKYYIRFQCIEKNGNGNGNRPSKNTITNVAKALELYHKIGIAHNDVSPSNISHSNLLIPRKINDDTKYIHPYLRVNIGPHSLKEYQMNDWYALQQIAKGSHSFSDKYTKLDDLFIKFKLQ